MKKKKGMFKTVRVTMVFTEKLSHSKAMRLVEPYRNWLNEGVWICPPAGESWEILDDRSFGRLRLVHLWAGAVKRTVLHEWKQIRLRDVGLATMEIIKMWRDGRSHRENGRLGFL